MSNVRFLDQVSVSSFGSVGGNVGPSGSAGPSGSQGPEGNLAIWKYSIDTTGSTAPPVGYFELDTAWSSVTSYISIADFSYNPVINWGSVLNNVTVGAVIKVSKNEDSTIYKIFEVNAISPLESGYERYYVTQLGSNGTPSNDDEFGISFPFATSTTLGTYEDGVLIENSTLTMNFTGSGFNVTSAGSNGVIIENTGTDPFPYTGSAVITGSLEIIGFSTLTGSLFVQGTIGEDALAVYSGSEKKVSVNSEGVLGLDEFAYTPNAIAGGVMYSGSNFWLGIE